MPDTVLPAARPGPLPEPPAALPHARFLDRSTPPHIATLILVSGMGALTTSIFLPSLADMADHFGVSYGVMQFAVSGYFAATAVLQVLVGAMADALGRRPVMLAAFAIYVGATLGTLMAPDIGWFMAFRLLQAVAITGLVLARAVVRDVVGQDQSASMIGYITMGMAVIPMIGPSIGGALDQVYGWRASFVVLAALGAAVLVLVAADQGETARTTGGGLVHGLRRQVRAYPALLGSRRFWGYSLAAAFASGAFFALLGGASFVAGEVFGLSPFWTGVALGSPAVGYAAGNFLSGRFSARVGIDRMAVLGCTVATLGMAASLLLTLGGVLSPWVVFGFCTTLGLGNGLTLPNAMAGSISVDPALAGSASGLSGAIMTAGGAVLSALAATLLTTETGPWPLQAIMAATQALAGLSLLLVRGTAPGRGAGS